MSTSYNLYEIANPTFRHNSSLTLLNTVRATDSIISIILQPSSANKSNETKAASEIRSKIRSPVRCR